MAYRILSLVAVLSSSHPAASADDERVYVCRIECVKADDKGLRVYSSGCIVKGRDGVFTAYHGVRDARRIVVVLPGRRPRWKPLRFEARLVEVDVRRDVAYLEPTNSNVRIPAGGLGLGIPPKDEDLAQTDSTVIGYPAGTDLVPYSAPTVIGDPAIQPLWETLTPGARSALKAHAGVRMVNLHGALVPGHSGSPVLDRDGALVGIFIGGIAKLDRGWAAPFHELSLTPYSDVQDEVEFRNRFEKLAGAKETMTHVVGVDTRALIDAPSKLCRNRLILHRAWISAFLEGDQAKKKELARELDSTRLCVVLPRTTRIRLLGPAQHPQPTTQESDVEQALVRDFRHHYVKAEILSGDATGNRLWIRTAHIRWKVEN